MGLSHTLCNNYIARELWAHPPRGVPADLRFGLRTLGPPSLSRGVPSDLTVTIKQTPGHPFSGGVANNLLYTVGFRQRHAIK